MTNKINHRENYCESERKKIRPQTGVLNAFSWKKFIPPRTDPTFHLFRAQLVATMAQADKRVTFIQGRPGQGKSTTAVQFLQHLKTDYAWLQLDQKDKAPVVFFSAFLIALEKLIPKLGQTAAYQTVASGTAVEKPEDLLTAIMKQLKPLIKKRIYLVLDGLEHIIDSEKAVSLIHSIIRHAPTNLCFLLISRRVLNNDSLFFKDNCLLDNDNLALSQGEVADLFANVLKTPIPALLIKELHQRTEGWIKGLILIHSCIQNDFEPQGAKKATHWTILCQKRLREYFDTEVLAHLTEPQRHCLFSLAHLEQIPVTLAQTLAPFLDTIRFIECLIQHNLFLRRLPAFAQTYGIHPLFRDALRDLAQKKLTQKKTRIVFAKSGQWYLRQKQYEPTLKYYIRSQAYGMVEKVIQKTGLLFWVPEQPLVTLAALQSIPSKVIESKAWIALAAAALHFSIDPTQSKKHLTAAYRNADSEKNQTEALLILSGLITYHGGIDCDFNIGKKLLPRAEAIFSHLGGKLSTSRRLQVAGAIANGLCYFSGQFERAARYAQDIIQTAQQNGLDALLAMGVVTRGMICILDGKWSSCKPLIETATSLTNSQSINKISQIGLISLQLIYLAHIDDPVTYQRYQQILNSAIDSQLIPRTIFGPILCLLDAIMAIRQGSNGDAKFYLDRAIRSKHQSTHVQSLYWAQYAFIHALENNSKDALSAIEESCRLRALAGGEYFHVLNKIHKSCIYAYTGKYEIADHLLTEVIDKHKYTGNTTAGISAYAFRAYARLKAQHKSTGLADLTIFLEKLRHDKYPILEYFHPALMEKLLKMAAKHDKALVQTLRLGKRYQHTILSSSKIHFTSLEINTLGCLEIALQGKTRITFADFTKAQRELLALMICAPPARGVSYHQIQEIFWPDGSAEQTRSNLDNLLSRMKKVFSTLLAPHPITHYFSTNNGYVRLQNCIIDVKSFNNNFQQGMRLFKDRQFWHACNKLLKAFYLYKGNFLPGIFLNGTATYWRENILYDFINCAAHCGRILSDMGYVSKAIEVYQKAISFDPGNEAIVRELYRAYNKNSDAVQARKIIRNYQELLKEDGFSDMEIQESTLSICH